VIKQRTVGVALLAYLAAYLWLVLREPWHGFWSCHIATLSIALGLILGVRLLVQAGFLFHLAIGLPVWLIEIAVNRPAWGWKVYAGSIVAHVAPLVIGWIFSRGERMGWAPLWLAWSYQALAVFPARWFTPPELNINLAHRVWGPVEGVFSMTTFQLVGNLIVLGVIWVSRKAITSFRDSEVL
jgi:hypothetical protein